MIKPDETGLSADEFKNRLYYKLKEKGHVDALKAQLRCRLVEELQKSRLSLPIRPKYTTDEESLLYRAANSLVADHLRRCSFDYTLSVFLPESGTAHDKIFSIRDLLQLLHIPPQSKLYKRLSERIPDYDSRGFLWQLLCEVANIHAYTDRENGAQTDIIPYHPLSSLDDKLTEVDKKYSAKKNEIHHSGRLATEERILSYQKQLEDRSNMHIKMEISRFKENELARMRVEEREKCRKELEDLRREMERSYQAKVSALVERERNAIERLQKQQEGQEKEVYVQRQSILEEIETVRQREAQLKREGQVSERERKLNEDKYHAKDELLIKREYAVKRMEDHFDKKLEGEMTRFKLDEQARYVQRLKELEVREARNQEDLKIIGAEKESLKHLRQELQEKKILLNEMESKYQQAKIEVISMSKRNEVLHEKVREMVDYQYIKEENAVLRKELETVKSRMAELNFDNERERRKQEDLVREMVDRSGKPTAESLLMQQQMSRTKEVVDQEKMMSEYIQKELEEKLRTEITSSKHVLRRFEDQALQQKEMNREIIDLRHQLLQTQLALNNAVNKNPDPMLRSALKPVKSFKIRSSQSEDESEMSLNDRPTSPDDYYDTTFGKSSPEPELMLVGERYRRRARGGDSTCNDDDHFIHDMKNRLKDLEKEAENLEASYHSFQAKMSNLHVGWPLESVRTTASKYKVVFADSVANSMGLGRDVPNRSPPVGVSLGSYVPPRSPTRRSPIPSPRPLSSTPYKLSGSDKTDYNTRSDESRPSVRNNLLPSFGLSTVTHTESHGTDTTPMPVPAKRKAVTVDDLEARPGSPSVVVLPGSQTTDTYTGSSQPEQEALRPTREVSMSDLKTSPDRSVVPETPQSSFQLPSLEDAWKSQHQPAVSSDVSWKTDGDSRLRHSDSEERRRSEEMEEQNWEEQRRQREGWRKKRDEEQREKEKMELENLMKAAESKKKSNLAPLERRSPAVAKSPELEPVQEKNNNEEKIDPVMQKYMEMVQQQKQKEKQVAKATVHTWHKGHEITPPTSDHDLSVAEEESKGAGAADSDGFEW